MRIFITILALLFSFASNAQDAAYCLQVKLEPVKHKLNMKQLETAVVKYKLTNCGGQDLLIDKNAATEYEDSSATIYFKIYRCETDCEPYAFKKQYFQKVSDAILYIIKPNYSYTYDFPLFELYTIKEPGKYRVVGYYRKMIPGNDGEPVAYIATSEPVDVLVTK